MYKNKFLWKINLILLIFVFALICFCLKSYAVDNENGELSISMSRVIEDGVYYITSSQDSNLVVEVKDGNFNLPFIYTCCGKAKFPMPYMMGRFLYISTDCTLWA